MFTSFVFISSTKTELVPFRRMETRDSVDMFAKVLENQLLQTAKLVEEHLDSEIQKVDQMDEDELERLKEKRLEALRKAQQQKQVTSLPCFLKLLSQYAPNNLYLYVCCNSHLSRSHLRVLTRSHC